jgi:hypothetical protein
VLRFTCSPEQKCVGYIRINIEPIDRRHFGSVEQPLTLATSARVKGVFDQ